MKHTYPLPSMEAARGRLRHLEKLIRGVDARLKLAQPPAVPGLETERGRLTQEFDRLYAAVDLLGEKLRQLPRCACGKVSHRTLGFADKHARALKLIDADREHEVNAYPCDEGPERVWHVGHLKKLRRPAAKEG